MNDSTNGHTSFVPCVCCGLDVSAHSFYYYAADGTERGPFCDVCFEEETPSLEEVVLCLVMGWEGKPGYELCEFKANPGPPLVIDRRGPGL
jgi:hypothetical protein